MIGSLDWWLKQLRGGTWVPVIITLHLTYLNNIRNRGSYNLHCIERVHLTQCLQCPHILRIILRLHTRDQSWMLIITIPICHTIQSWFSMNFTGGQGDPVDEGWRIFQILHSFWISRCGWFHHFLQLQELYHTLKPCEYSTIPGATYSGGQPRLTWTWTHRYNIQQFICNVDVDLSIQFQYR